MQKKTALIAAFLIAAAGSATAAEGSPSLSAELGGVSVKISNALTGEQQSKLNAAVVRVGAGYTYSTSSGYNFNVSGKLGTSMYRESAWTASHVVPILLATYSENELRATAGKSFGALDAYAGLEVVRWRVEGQDAMIRSRDMDFGATHRKLILGGAYASPIPALPALNNVAAEVGYVMKTSRYAKSRYGENHEAGTGGTSLKVSATFDVDGKGFTVTPYYEVTKPNSMRDLQMQTSRFGLIANKAF